MKKQVKKAKKNNFDNIKKNLLTISGLVILVVALVGISYVVFNYTDVISASDNQINKGTITMSYAEPTTVINLTNQLPVSDTTGAGYTNFFEFVVSTTATGKLEVPYEISITPVEIAKLKVKKGCEDESIATEQECIEKESNWKVIEMGQEALKTSEVKVYLTKKINEGTEIPVLEPTKISNLEASKYAKLNGREGSLKIADIIDDYTNQSGKETVTTYRLRMWIADDAEISKWDENITYQYKLKVNVDSRLK